MDYIGILLPFVGGLGMFIYGMQIMAQGLENAAGNRMKTMLEALTRNKFFGVLLGAFITAVIQSSSATTVMVVGFVNAGIMDLQQAMGVIMGANIGTTVTGWLVSSVEWAKFLSPATLAPLAVIIGVIIMLTGKRSTTKDISSIIVGFGLLFLGITSMSAAVEPLKDSEAFRSIFVSLGRNPFLGILAGALVTAIIQSSSASVGILQSLSAAGLVPFGAAIYIIMGQNIGTCVTALMSSIGAKKNAKTAAMMHLLFNIIGTAVFSVFAILYLKVADPIWAQGAITQTEISLVHTVFNITTTVLLFPASNLIVSLAKKIGRVNDEGARENAEVLLDERMLETPGIAIQTMIAEIIRMGHIVKSSLKVTERVLFTLNPDEIKFLKEEEERVDQLSAGITDYAIKLSSMQISVKEHQMVSHMLEVVSDMERISDYCENVSEFAETMRTNKLSFSDKGKEDMREMARCCSESYSYALDALENNNKESAEKTIKRETEADTLEIKLRADHIDRLIKHQCNTESGIIFLDALIGLERISDHARNIAEEVLEAE